MKCCALHPARYMWDYCAMITGWQRGNLLGGHNGPLFQRRAGNLLYALSPRHAWTYHGQWQSLALQPRHGVLDGNIFSVYPAVWLSPLSVCVSYPGEALSSMWVGGPLRTCQTYTMRYMEPICHEPLHFPLKYALTHPNLTAAPCNKNGFSSYKRTTACGPLHD